jgi:aspartate/methionine/tyrosine aminotransferase
MRKEFRSRNDTPLSRDIRRAYAQSGLTQKQFAARLPVNPKTGKPYNDRTIRKWIGGERSTRNIEPTLHQPGASTRFVQQFKTSSGETKSFRLRAPRGKSILDYLVSDQGEKAIRQAIANAYKGRYATDDVDENVELLSIAAATNSGKKVYNLNYFD